MKEHLIFVLSIAISVGLGYIVADYFYEKFIR